MRTAKRILLACTAMAAVTTSAHASDLPIAYSTKAPPPAACASHEDFRDTDCSLLSCVRWRPHPSRRQCPLDGNGRSLDGRPSEVHRPPARQAVEAVGT
jgi:hypothetical protein